MLPVKRAFLKCTKFRRQQHKRHKRSLASAATWNPKSIDVNAIVMPFAGQAPNKLKNMLFLHGLFGSGGNWRAIASAVQGKTLLNTHLLDARNHGLSPHTTEMNFDLMAEDILRYILKNDLGRCVLLGHSMGGRTAMTFASKYPELVDKLIIVDVAPVQYGLKHYDYHLGLMRSLKQMDLNTITSRRQAEADATKFISDPITRGFLLQNLVGDPDRPEHYKWRLNLDLLYETLPKWIDTPDLQRFTGPTMFIAGGASEYVKPEYHPTIQSLYPNSQIVTIPNGTHYVHYEKPAEFVDLAVPFILRR